MSALLTQNRGRQDALRAKYNSLLKPYMDAETREFKDPSAIPAEVRAEADAIRDELSVLIVDAEVLASKYQEERFSKPIKKVASESRGSISAEMRAMDVFLRKGTPDQVRAQSADVLIEGGLLLAPQMFVQQLIQKVDDEVYLNRKATVYNNVPLAGLGAVSLEGDLEEPVWGTETSTATEGDADFTGRSLTPIEAKLMVKISDKALENPAFDIASFIQGRAAYKYSIRAERAYMVGNGVNQPLGLFTASDIGIPTSRDTTSASSGTLVGDDFIDAIHSVKGPYMNRGEWILHRNIIKLIRKLKDSSGQYLWNPTGNLGDPMANGNPATLLGRPYSMSEYAPSAATSGNYVALFGDLSHYWIANGADLKVKVLDQTYAENFQVGYRFLARMDAMPVLSEAFARLKVQ